MARMNMKNATDPEECEHVTWTFEPLRPLREDHPGETAYLSIFQRRMNGPQVIDVYFLRNEPDLFPLLEVFKDLGWPREGEDRLVATLMMWLGTNAGRSFRENAKALTQNIKSPFFKKEDVYLAQWALENKEVRYVQGYPRLAVMEGITKTFNRAVTLRDVQVLEHAVSWLGTKEGQAYLSAAEKSYRYKQDRINQQHRANAGSFRLPHNLTGPAS